MSAGPHPLRERGIDLLTGLVGFPSVSLSPNDDIVGYIEEWLGAHMNRLAELHAPVIHPHA